MLDKFLSGDLISGDALGSVKFSSMSFSFPLLDLDTTPTKVQQDNRKAQESPQALCTGIRPYEEEK